MSSPAPSTSHLVLIPSYNSGPLLMQTVVAARRYWAPVWVVIDGSDDESVRAVLDYAQRDDAVRVIHREVNGGKGAALFAALQAAAAAGFSHALTMDADTQHPADAIELFMHASAHAPRAAIYGVPQFHADAPALRRNGRRISNFFAQLETLGQGAQDSLFGFRVYPIAPLLRIMRTNRWMRRFDFDPEAAVRLSWAGVPSKNVPASVRYLRVDEGGISHFHYGRDNLLLSAMHVRLLLGALWRLPMLLLRGRARAD